MCSDSVNPRCCKPLLQTHMQIAVHTESAYWSTCVQHRYISSFTPVVLEPAENSSVHQVLSKRGRQLTL